MSYREPAHGSVFALLMKTEHFFHLCVCVFPDEFLFLSMIYQNYMYLVLLDYSESTKLGRSSPF